MKLNRDAFKKACVTGWLSKIPSEVDLAEWGATFDMFGYLVERYLDETRDACAVEVAAVVNASFEETFAVLDPWLRPRLRNAQAAALSYILGAPVSVQTGGQALD